MFSLALFMISTSLLSIHSALSKSLIMVSYFVYFTVNLNHTNLERNTISRTNNLSSFSFNHFNFFILQQYIQYTVRNKTINLLLLLNKPVGVYCLHIEQISQNKTVRSLVCAKNSNIVLF